MNDRKATRNGKPIEGGNDEPNNLVLTLHTDSDDYVVLRNADTNEIIGRVRIAEIKPDRCRVLFQFPRSIRVDRRLVDQRRQEARGE